MTVFSYSKYHCEVYESESISPHIGSVLLEFVQYLAIYFDSSVVVSTSEYLAQSLMTQLYLSLPNINSMLWYC